MSVAAADYNGAAEAKPSRSFTVIAKVFDAAEAQSRFKDEAASLVSEGIGVAEARGLPRPGLSLIS